MSERNKSASKSLASVIKNLKTFDKKEAAEYEETFKIGGMSLLNKKIKEDMSKWRNVPVNIAVTGSPGVGKSSFINKFRGVKPRTEGAAAVGVNETTTEPTKYMHPDNNSIALWDLPGIGTQKFPKEKYLEEVGFERYDFFLILTATRFHENDIWLAKKVEKLEKKFIFIRTKMNYDVDNNEKDNDESKFVTVDKIRNEMAQQIATEQFENVKVYLIDNRDDQDYDFPILIEKMIKEAPVWKQEAMTLTLTSLTGDLINRKKNVLRKRIMIVALGSALGGAVPMPGVSIAVDKEIIMHEVDFYKQQFGLDDESLQKMSLALEIALENLKGRLRTAVSTVQMVTNFTTALVASEITEKMTAYVLPVFGCIVAGGISYCSTASILWSLLDECVADAQTINEQLVKRYSNQDFQQ
ncbi:interferon-inducible GTPase 5-like [Ruditapes philippinarum]|uniref:interferon-inducible GTPase 5-like n=1 Tax=Ruditapes philippinarum TaxID=129788 RepID=UPI00295AAF45|nr:interferon-inducible GTPase 5-like [Ruditapes philippinarum]